MAQRARVVPQGTLFDERFLGRYAGAIMADPTTALVELVANAWDAYATKVEVTWPEEGESNKFSIFDNGIGMTREEFEVRWRTLDYDRLTHQGDIVHPPSDLPGSRPRMVYGRNGKGRLAAFHFSSPYRVRTWRDGKESIFLVSQGAVDPIEIQLERVSERQGHGTEISAVYTVRSAIMADGARSILSTRFLTNPDFVVSVNGIRVTFSDIPPDSLKHLSVQVPLHGTVTIRVIDSQRTDRTTKQHGIAWWVNRRLVGHVGWSLSDHERVVDGRTELAKRFTFIVEADFLAPSVRPDWSGFMPDDDTWLVTEEAVQNAILAEISAFGAERRARTKDIVSQSHIAQVSKLPLLGRDRWTRFLDQVVEKCPNLTEANINQVMGLLVNLEASDSQYSLLSKMHGLRPDDLDGLNEILEKWTIQTAKEVLDEIERRLKLIEEIRNRTADRDADEVQELQPLFSKGLWIFGPQFESIEYTSNRGMTAVIKELFGGSEAGSRNRPDFVIRPDSTIGFYSRSAFDSEYNPVGVDTLVIVDLKRPGVRIGSGEKEQIWKYITELVERGYIGDATRVYGHILGDNIRPADNMERSEGGRFFIRPMLYSTFIFQAEKRMLNLRETVAQAPFMKAFLSELEEKVQEPPADLLSEFAAPAPTEPTGLAESKTGAAAEKA